MADFSQIVDADRLAIDIPVRPYLLDHHFEGRAVYPAVESMETLSVAAIRFRPGINVTRMAKIRFDKFLPIPADSGVIDALVDFSSRDDAGIAVTLSTRLKLKNRKMSRIKTHATLVFPDRDKTLPEPPIDIVFSPDGPVLEVSADDIYRDLVPFGPAYQNILDPLIISADGGLVTIRAGSENGNPAASGLLGSPFPLDAAFHGACVWGQRFAGIVAFPVGIEYRHIVDPTIPGETYFGQILPRQVAPELLVFDIWIHDRNGGLREIAKGVRMQDVSGGRVTPPTWIRKVNSD